MTDPRGDVWPPEHITTLMQDYPRHGAAYVAKQLFRSETSVRVKACRLKIKRRVSRVTCRYPGPHSVVA